jgi:hypothetical protein
VKQRELREALTRVMIDYLIDQGMDNVIGCFELGDPENPAFEPDIEKAMDSAYYSINKSLKEISRLATRLGYIEKEVTHR